MRALRQIATAACFAASLLAGGVEVALAQDPLKTDERRVTALADAFADVAKKASPSVVKVLSAGHDEIGYGAVIDDGSFVLTDGSMLAGLNEDRLEVRTSGGEVLLATIASRNEAFDVALIKIAGGRKLEPLPLGSSKKLAIGQWVVTVGTAPRPLAVGVVSALERRVEPHAEANAMDLFGLFSESAGPRRAYARVIQHDSPIDGEKYGAPLVDADGRLVGINVTNAYRGSAYAAPIDDVAKFLDDLKAGKPGPAIPRPGYMGVAIGTVRDPETAKRAGIMGRGIEIHEVEPGLPAAKGGLKGGDVILAVDGEKVQSPERFGQVIGATLPGQTIKVRVLRSGRELELPVTVTERPKRDE